MNNQLDLIKELVLTLRLKEIDELEKIKNELNVEHNDIIVKHEKLFDEFSMIKEKICSLDHSINSKIKRLIKRDFFISIFSTELVLLTFCICSNINLLYSLPILLLSQVIMLPVIKKKIEVGLKKNITYSIVKEKDDLEIKERNINEKIKTLILEENNAYNNYNEAKNLINMKRRELDEFESYYYEFIPDNIMYKSKTKKIIKRKRF